MMRGIFEEIDEDGSGYIDSEELKNFLTQFS